MMEWAGLLRTTVVVCCFIAAMFSSASGQCGSGAQADMVFVLDASGSVGSGNFQTMLVFVQDLIDGFTIGSNEVRVGVQKYSSGTNTEFNLHDDYVKSSVKNRVANIVYTGGGTNTGGALEYLRTTMFTTGNGDRAGVTNIGVILTDGVSNSYSLTATQAANARNAGITLFAIGIGSGIPVTELNEIATDPDSDHVFSVSGFSALNSIISTFQANACPVVNGGWSSWGSWGGCSLTCGGGTMTRSRACNNPTPSNGGATCSGSGSDSASCNTHNCPIDGAWTTWTSWGTCSVTCNVGTHSRSRSCTNPSPQYGGANCVGHSSETQSCDVGPSVDGCQYSGNTCTGCNPGYSFSGSDCNWCKTNFTGCSCEFCQTDHIGYNTDCGVLCYNGDPDVPGGRFCVCYANTVQGHWQGSACDSCKTGWMSPLCTTCDYDYVGPYHCTIRCRWGQGYHVYKDDGDWGSRSLTPTFDCVVDHSNGYYTAYFGYINSNNHNIYVSDGLVDSYLTGTSGTLPTMYRPGTFNYVFSTASFVAGSSVSWTLGYTRSNTVFTVSVPSNPTVCGSTPTSTIPTGAIEVVDPGHCHCMPGYYGSECQSVCPGGVGSPCYNHGTCDQVSGACTCDPHWDSGTNCQYCETGWSGGDCTVAVPTSTRTTPSSNYLARAFADGGFITFDGSMYTFNGVGEYLLWSSRSGMTSEVAVYGRKTLTSSNGLATSIDALAIESGGNKLEIYAGDSENSRDGTAYLSTENGQAFVTTTGGQLATGVTYKRVASDHYQVYASPYYTINVYVRGRTLDVSIESNSYSCYDTYGLLSACDNSASNDMRASDGTVYSGSSLTTQTIHENFAPSYLISAGDANCGGGAKVDMVFVLDASGSVGYNNFQLMKQFIRDMINDLDIGTDKVRVGVQKFSTSSNTEFNLHDYYDKNTMGVTVDAIHYTSGSTNTGEALQYLRNTMFNSGNGDRSNVNNVGIIMTDGTSNNYALTASEAANARNAGITLFAIGIGSGIPVSELNEIATDPDADHVFAVSDFNGLTAIRSTLKTQACSAASSSKFTYNYNPYPRLSGNHMCFDRTYMVSDPVATFSTGQITIELKMKVDPANTGCGVLFSYRNSDVFTVLACSTYFQVYEPSIGSVNVPTIAFTSDTWYHAAFVWSPSSESLRVLLYDTSSNGQAVDVSLTSLSSNPFIPGGTFTLGRYNSLPANPEKLQWGFIGCLDDLRIWDTAVSDSNVNTRAWTYVAKDTSSLSSIWRFDEGEGETTQDQMSDTQFAMQTESPWTKPQWNRTDYELDPLNYATYSLDYNITGTYDRDFDLRSSMNTFCNNLIYGSFSSCSSLGAAQHEYFYLHCIYSGMAHRTESKLMEMALAFADYCQAITGSGSLSQNLCNTFPGRTFPYYSGGSCSVVCQSGSIQNGACVCAAGFWGSQCTSSCPATTNGPCNGYGVCSSSSGQCSCPDNFQSGTNCVTCKSGWSGHDCSLSVLSQAHNGSYYMCAGYEGAQFITLDGLSYSAPKAGEFKMLDIADLDLYIRQVGCNTDQFCITGVWAVLGGDNVAIRAPMSSGGDALVEVNSNPVTLATTMTLATDVYVELYSPDLYLLHYRNRYDVFIRVYDHTLQVQALVKSSYCNVDTGLCGSCNNNAQDDFKDPDGNTIDYTTTSERDIVDVVLPQHEVSSGTTTYFIYQTTYTEPRDTNGGGYGIALNNTALESQYLDVFTSNVVTLDFQVKPNSAYEGTVVGFTSDEIVSISAEGTYKLKINGTVYDSGISVTANEWNHVTMTYFKNNGSVQFYVDTETGDSQQNDFTISETIFNSPGVITVGGLSPRPGESLSSVDPPTFEGEFDNLRVWNRSFDMITAKQNSFVNVNSSFDGLVTQWTFSEGQGSVATDSVGGLTMNVPRQDTAQWQLSGPTMNVIDGLSQQQGRTDVILVEQFTQTAQTSSLLSVIASAETFCQDLIYNSQVHSQCSGSMGSNVAVFFYDKCRTANMYTSDSRSYSVQALLDYADHCRVLTNPGTDPVQTVCQSHCQMVQGTLCTGCASGTVSGTSTCRFGYVNSTTTLCVCDSGFWGTECSQVCPGGASTPCNNRGTCNADTGVCVCQGRFSGSDCSSCASSWSGTNCDVMTPNPSDPWLTSTDRMCSLSVAGSVMAFGGKKFSMSTAGDFHFVKRDYPQSSATGIQARLLQCLSGQVCLTAVAFHDNVDELTVELDPFSDAVLVTLNGVLQPANIGTLTSTSFTLSYQTSFSLEVRDQLGMVALVGLVDSRLNLILQTPNTLMGHADSLCGDGTVNTMDTSIPGTSVIVSPGNVIFNSSVTTTYTSLSGNTVIPTNASYGTAGGSMYLNQTFLSSDPTSGLFVSTAPGTVEMFIRPYQAQGVLFSYGYDSSFSVFLNDTLQIMLGEDVYDTGFQVTPGEWSQVAVAWDPALNLTTVYHVTDQNTMDFKRITVTNMSCFQDGGVVSIGKWTQPNKNANHPPTDVVYLGEVDEARLWSQHLSHSDIQSGFQQPVDTSDPTLVARWTFDEGQGKTVYDFRGTHLYVSDHSKSGTTPEWRLSDAPVAYTSSGGSSNRTSTFITDAQTVCSSAVGSFTTGNCAGLSSDVSTFYLAACQDLVLQTGNLTKAAEIVATMVALCNVGASTPLTVADYWCDPYAGNYLLGTGTTCSNTCMFPNTTRSTRTSCVCADGYWGTGCDGTCPGGPSNPCHSHGTCDTSTGNCVCQVNWQGSTDCSSCTSGWTGADCSVSYISTTNNVVCSVASNGRFTLFDGATAQYTGLGGYILYEEPSGPKVIVEQAPCSKMQACVYRVILTYNADILVFDLTTPNQGLKVVNNGAEIFVYNEVALANGLLISKPATNQHTVRSSNNNFNLDVTVREAYLAVDMLVDKNRCAANTGVCGPCQTQSTSSCVASDIVCYITNLGVKDATNQTTVTSTETGQFIASQKINVTSTELGYSGGGSTTYTSVTSQVETSAGYGLELTGEGASSEVLPANTLDTSKNITMEAVIYVDNPEGTVLSYADDSTFAININQGVFEVQCGSQVETTGISATTGNWSHVSVVYDSVTGRTMFNYIDDAQIPSYSVLTLPTNCFPDQGTLSVGQFQLAKNDSGPTPAGQFRGQVDRVTLWNRRFGPADLLSHWDQDFDPTGEPDLKAYWNFNEGQGNTAIDAVGGVKITLPSSTVWSVSQAPIDTGAPVTQQHTTGAQSVLSTHEQLAVTTCTTLIHGGPIHSSCGLLSDRANYYYVSCVSDVTQARDADYAMDSVLQFATECQTTLGLNTWPAQTLCNNFPSRTFPTWFGSSCTLRCDFGTKMANADACECDSGYWGTNCDQLCPGTANGAECSGHGVCQQGSGSCACMLQWQGDSTCSSCTSGWTGNDCSIMAPSSGNRPPTMCTVDRGGFLLTHDLYGVTLDQPSTYTILSMDNFQIQVTQVACSIGLCVQGVGINYHNRNLVVSLDASSLLQVYVDGTVQYRGVAQSLDPTSITGCPLTLTWNKDKALMIELAPISFKLLVNAVGSSLSVVLKDIATEACCGTRMSGLCGSCGTCSSPFTDTCQLTSASPAPAPSTPSAPSCNVAFNNTLGQTDMMNAVTCASVNSSYNMFSSLLSTNSMGITKSFYELQEAPGEGICFDKSSALVKHVQLMKTDYVTLEFLVKSCNTSDCYGTLISYTKDQTFSIRHSSEVAVTYGPNIYATNFKLEDKAWNQISVVFDKISFEMNLYYFDSNGLAGRKYIQFSEDVLPDDGYMGVGRWQPSTHAADMQHGAEIFKGCIDQLRFWNRTFDNIQVQNHWNVTHEGTESNLTALWKFDHNRNGYTYDVIHDAEMLVPPVPFPPGEIDYSDAPVPYNELNRRFPYPVSFSFSGRRRKRSITSTLPLTDIINICEYIFVTSDLAQQCTGVGSQMTEKYFFDCLSDMYYGEDITDALSSTLAYSDYCEITLALTSWPARTLCNYFPFDAGFPNWIGDNCDVECVSGGRHPDNNNTCLCDHGYHGANCSQLCPGGSQNPCSGFGTCDVTTGVCPCPVSRRGSADCGTCQNGWQGTNCVITSSSSSSFSLPVAKVSDLGHILNLDGVGFGFQGMGEYHLLQLRPNIVLEGKFIMCNQNFSCLNFVGMRVGTNGDGYAKITIQAPYLTNSEPLVYVNGVLDTVRKKAYFRNFEIRRESLHEVVLDVYNTVQVIIRSRKRLLDLTVTVPASNVPASVGLLAGSGSTNWNNKENYIADYSRISAYMALCHSGVSTQGERSSQYYSGTMSLPTSSVLSNPSSQTLDLSLYFAQFVVNSCDSVIHYPSADFTAQEGDGYSLKFDSTAVFSQFDTAVLMSSNLSIEVLVKVDSTGQGGVMLSFATTTHFMIFVSSTWDVQVFYDGVWYNPGLQLQTDVWNKVLFVYESALGNVSMYTFDQSNVVKRKDFSMPTAIFDTPGRLALGQGLPPQDGVYYTPYTSFKGELDNFRLWKIIVEPTMVIDVSDLGMSLTDFTIRAAWTFDEAEGDNAYDLIQGAILALPVAPWAAPSWTASDKTNTYQVATSPLVHYFVNKTLETEAESQCSTLISAVASLTACSSLSAGEQSFYLMQCIQQVAKASDIQAAYLAMYDLGDVCYNQLNAPSWPLTAHCTGDTRRGTDCLASCVFGDWDGSTCTCYDGFSGTDCSQACPTANGVYCNGHGTCSSGSCVCDHNWQGTSCSSCASGWTGAECTVHYGSRLTSNPRTGFLSATGEVITFDGASYTFSGAVGVYKVVEDPSDGMYVQAHTSYCEYGTCVDGIGVRMSNYKVTLYAPPRAYALPKVKIDGTEISITGTEYTIHSNFKIYVMARNSLKVAISSPYQCDITVTSAGRFLQAGVYVRSYMCSSSTGLMGRCDGSNSNDLYYTPTSYTQATLMSQLSSLYEVTFSSSIFSYDSATEFGGVTKNTKAGFTIDYTNTALQSPKLAYAFSTNQSYTLSFSYRPRNTVGAILTYSRNSSFVISNSNPIVIQIGSNNHSTSATSTLNSWNQIVVEVDRANNEVEFFHYTGGQMSYEKLSLGTHEFLEPDGWLTLGQLQVSIDEQPYTLWDGSNMFEGDISDVILLNGLLPHVVVTQTLQLKTSLLDFASSDVVYHFRLKEGTSYIVEDVAGVTDLQFAYAPWQTTPWDYSDQSVTQLSARDEDQWSMAIDYDERTRISTASTLCSGFFQHASITSACSGVDTDFKNQLEKQCEDSYLSTGQPEAVLHSMLAFIDFCDYIATVSVSSTTLCDAQFQSLPWVELRCTGCKHGYKIADGTCQCYPGYWDTDCSGTCPGGVDTPCNLHGTCNKDGTCTCNINWSGSSCSSCATGWTGTDCNTMVGDYISGAYTTAVAQIRSQTWVTTFDGNTFYLNTDDTYLLLRVHDTNFYVYGRQTLCGDDPKTFTCFDAFMIRHGTDYYFADWTNQDEHALTLKTLAGDVTVLTKRTFGTLTISRTSLNSFQFLESVADLLIDVTLYDHGPHITMQLLRKTDLVSLTLSGLLASCDTQFAAKATTCGGGVTMCHPTLATSSISHCQTSVSSTSFASLATQAISTEKTTFNTLAGSVPSHSVTEYMLYMNRTGLITADNLTLSTTTPTTFEIHYKPMSHGGVVFSYGDLVSHVALVDNDTSLNIVYMNKVVSLAQPSVLSEWNQVNMVWDPVDQHLELYLVDYLGNIYTVRTELDSNAFVSGGKITLGEMLPGATLSTNDHNTTFIGYMGELRIFTRPHNPTVISQNTFIDVTENTPDLQHAWNFDINEGDYFIDLKYSIHMIATNVTETPIWSTGDYTLNVKDGATSYWVTLPRTDPFEAVATQKCDSWFSNATLMANCQIGNAFIDTYKLQCYEDQLARRNHSEGMKSVLQFAEFCRRLEIHSGSPTSRSLDTLVHNASDLCQEFPEAVFQAYWGTDCLTRCVFGRMENGECHCTDPYWGPECDQACPVSNTADTAVCDQHGHCRKTDGVCVCQSRWTSVSYNFSLYPVGYVDNTTDYACTVCSDGWFGIDCSTALLQRTVNGSDGYAVISSTVIITVDGASMELSKTGAYRLFTSTNITVDGYFKQCNGRYDCRTLQEVSIDYNGDLVSVSVKDNDEFRIFKSDAIQSYERDAPVNDNQGNILVMCAGSKLCRVSVDYGIEMVLESFRGEILAGFIVSQNLTNIGVGGLLGNFDGNWLNEFYTGGLSDNYYIANVLSAVTKHQEAEANHNLTSPYLILNNTELFDNVTATGGYLLRGNHSAFTAAFSNINLNDTDEFTLEMWVYIEEDSGHTYDLFTIATDAGDATLSVDNGQLKLNWLKTYTSHVTVSQQTWSRVVMTWRNSDGLVYLYRLESGGASMMDLEWGFPYGQNITFLSLTFGGSTTSLLSIDYARVWSIVRGINDLLGDLNTYDTTMYHGVEFVALFDEGYGTQTLAKVVFNDTVYSVQGTLTNPVWAVSDIPVTHIINPADLPAIVNETFAVIACTSEFEEDYTAYCPDFGSIKQLLLELCISDVIRYNDPKMKMMASSAFAFYCQAVTQEEKCKYQGYLDFCPDNTNLLPLILGVVFGTLGCCSCCLLLALLRKKIFGDDEQKPPQKKPDGMENGENGPEGKKGKNDFEEKEFTGGDLPPDAQPPVPPPSTNMYNYLSKMDGVDADDQDLFTKYNRSPSVNSIAISLQSYGIGSGGSGMASPSLPTSPSRASLGQIHEEPSDPQELARQPSLRRPGVITPVQTPL